MNWNWRPHAAWMGALALTATAATAQGTTGRIVGTVTESAASTPLPNATVGVVGSPTPLGGRTGSDGRYASNNLAPGRYDFRAFLRHSVIIFQVPGLLILACSHDDLCEPDLRLRQVEAAFVRVVKLRDLRIADCNA